MKLQFFSGEFSNIDRKRREELTEIADRYYDARLSVERMMAEARGATSALSNEEFLFVEHLMRQKTVEEPGFKPIVRGIRVGDILDCTYNDMNCRQFYTFTGTETLYVAILVENPLYGVDDVRIDYHMGMKYGPYPITNVDEVIHVEMNKQQQFCIVTTEITKPKEVKGEQRNIFNYRLYVKELAREKELAGVDFQIIKGPDMRHNLDMSKYISVRSMRMFDPETPSRTLEYLPCKEDIDVKINAEFSLNFEIGLPEIEARFIVFSNKSYNPSADILLNAKAQLKDGATVYAAEGILFDQGTMASLPEGEYSCALFIWGEVVQQLEFQVKMEDDFDRLARELDIAPALFDDGPAEEPEPEKKEPEPKKIAHEYLTLNSLDLYKQTYIETLEPGTPSEGYTTFTEGFDGGLTVYAFFDTLKTIDDPDNLPLHFFLYDNMGRMLQSITANCSMTGDENNGKKVMCAFGTFLKTDQVRWDRGIYKFEGSLWDETLISIQFEVCDKDTRGTYDPIAAQPRIGYGGRKTVKEVENAREKLEEMIGIRRVKEKINAMKDVNDFARLRREAGLPFQSPSLHACFMGPSGTGKTTVAGLIGQIYHEMGLLSKGHVIYEERGTLIGRFYDSEQREVERALRNAQGGVLFIDEAYSLFVEEDPKDPGHKVIEALLTALSDESNRDWMLVLAGYSDDLEKMLNNANQGLRSRVKDRFYFDELSEDELIEVADLYCSRNQYTMTPEARRAIESVIGRAYASRTKTFGNARYVNEELMAGMVIQAMSSRVRSGAGKPTLKQLKTIEKEDVPAIVPTSASKKMDQLNRMIGLDSLKKSISSHLNYVNMLNMRMNHGLYTTMPPLHMVFTGNPGTGKTTVAELMGEIYASMGLISHGEVIKVEKRDLVGTHVGETEKKMNEVLDRARGNVLFIEEAHQLWSHESDNDYGKIVVDSLMGVLGNDRIDMIVILAGYGPEMKKLISMDRGFKSRFPYTFEFEDYSAEELMEIAQMTIQKENFVISDAAREKLAALVKSAVSRKEESFGNARFVNRLITTQILRNMSDRIEKLNGEPTKEQLMTIEVEDVPSSFEGAGDIEFGEFDEKLIGSALERLDSMVGLANVKQTIHNFVEVSRIMKNERRQIFGDHLVKWNFVGNSGTGKSTVAGIMADILKGMGLIDRPDVVEIKGEEIYNVNELRCDEILKNAMEKSKYGLLFVDSDAPMFKNPNQWALTGDQLRIKLASLTAELGGNGAIIIAEHDSLRQGTVRSPRTLVFEDYSAEELFEILENKLSQQQFTLSEEAAEKMRSYIGALCRNRSLSLANARTMKLLAESVTQSSLLRTGKEKDAVKGLITLDDVESFEWRKPVNTIGF